MITVRCSMCKGDVAIKREWYEFKRKFVCTGCANQVMVGGVMKFGRKYFMPEADGKVEVLEGEL